MGKREDASMKKCLVLVVLLLVCLTAPLAQGEAARYTAQSTTDFQLRAAPEEGARRLMLVPEESRVLVIQAGEEWSKIASGSMTGYARTRWLSKFRAFDPKDPIPGALTQTGIITLKAPAQAAVPGYSGNHLRPGDILAVKGLTGGQAELNMHRDLVTLPEMDWEFRPFVLWQEAREGDLLYAFTTYYNQETGGKLAASRAFNIELAADWLSGLVIPPREDFSFNRVCAPYVKSKGYDIAPIIGGSGKGYGGGVCQLSTTLYNAALGLPLRIDKWEVHRKRGVDYVPQHFDATVGLYSDLAFTNLLPYAIRLEVRPQNGALTVMIFRNGESGQARAK